MTEYIRNIQCSCFFDTTEAQHNEWNAHAANVTRGGPFKEKTTKYSKRIDFLQHKKDKLMF